MFSSRNKSIVVRSAMVLGGAAASIAMVAGTSGAAVKGLQVTPVGVNICAATPLVVQVDSNKPVTFLDNGSNNKGEFDAAEKFPQGAAGKQHVTVSWKPLTPGPHTLTIKQQGGKDWVQTVTVAGGLNLGGSACIPLPF